MNYATKNNKNIFPSKNGNGKININQLAVSVSGGVTKTIREELGEISVDKVDEAISYFSDNIRNKTVEHAIVIEKSGKVFHFIGDEKGITLYDVDLDGAYLLHNHPSNDGIFSFGKDDFEVMQKNTNTYYYLCNSEFDYKVVVIKSMDDISYSEVYHEAMEKHDLVNGEMQDEVMEIIRKRGYIEYDKRRVK